MAGGRRNGWRHPGLQGATIAAAAAVSLALNTHGHAPPRFDGAGYAVLARALATGRGYREIDHPERPRHAHFPPGYPLALAALWRVTGPSAESAHVASGLCTLAATLLFWRWFRALEPPGAAWLLGLALAFNWRWGRDGGAIRSEPLFLLLTGLALLASLRAVRRGGVGPGVPLGLLLGACTLTRHVGVALVPAFALDLATRGRRTTATVAVLIATAAVLPWVAWLATVRRQTQVGLLAPGGIGPLVAAQALFYLRRIPDQLTGPFVEVGTVFRPALRGPMTAWAALATAVIVVGWRRCVCTSRRRVAGLVPAAMLPLLLTWPFTEAGRFLVPLVPFLLVGAVAGLAPLAGRVGLRRIGSAAAVLLAALPYALYAAFTDRAGAELRGHAAFDAACAWIARHGDRPGPVLTRYPGEVFWQAGRSALAPPADDPAALDRLIARYRVAYLLVEGSRYARAAADPLARYVAMRPGRVALAWGQPVAVAVYAVASLPRVTAPPADTDNTTSGPP